MSSLGSPDIPLSPRISPSRAQAPAPAPAPAPAKAAKPAVGSSIREQAIEKYTALTRHKRELVRKNMKIQTKISQHLRKNKIELTISLGKSLSEEEEKAEYGRLLQELADIMETTEREEGEFEQEMTDIQVRKKKTDREIRKVESDFESLRSRVNKTARDSQTGSVISLETIHEINKKLANKESELRLLRLCQIKTKEKLRKQEEVHKPQVLDKQTVKREELNLENQVYSHKVEEDQDRLAALRHKIAGDVVMLSHLAMKLYYVKMDTEQLTAEDVELNKKIDGLKTELISLKTDRLKLLEEKDVLTEKAGMISNTILLTDFKNAQSETVKAENENENRRKQIMNFYSFMQ